MSNHVMGFQITASNPERLTNFYKQAFSWRFDPGPHTNVFDTDANGGTPGSIIGRGDHIPDYVSVFIQSDDVDVSLAAVEAAGGETLRPPFVLSNGDRLAIVADPEGHVLTLVQPKARFD